MADLDCPECEVCCALGICCPMGSEQQRSAAAALIVKEGKWTDPVLARSIADAAADLYTLVGRRPEPEREHAALQRHVAALVQK